ncbi:conserved domain protein [Parvimonas sp. oral taxon 393 str. F0440]|nr:conserved domain protein [Parvimonas sp. oral taxon 393 str. F0440]
MTSIAVKISLFIGKNNITKAEDLKTYLKVGFLVFLMMILILALDNLSLIIKNSIKIKRIENIKIIIQS